MICSIHQPNFLPWYPFFQKIEQADVFVILKHCQFEKNNYQNRFNYNDSWYTMSVNKGMELIKYKKYVNFYNDWNKIKSRLLNYKNFFSEFDNYINESLAETNISIIKHIANLLKIKTPIYEDWETDLLSSERLIDICNHYGADKYLAGGGGKNYMEIEKFHNAGIEVSFQEVQEENKIPVFVKLYG